LRGSGAEARIRFHVRGCFWSLSVRISCEHDTGNVVVFAGEKRVEVEKCRFFDAAYGVGMDYNRSALTLTQFEDRTAVVHQTVYIEARAFSEKLVQTGPRQISRMTSKSTDFKWTPFIELREKIICWVTSHGFNVVAAACMEGFLRIRSIQNGLKLATVSLNGEIATNVLITRKWGFIVVKTFQSFFVWTQTGSLIKRRSNSTKISHLMSFQSFDGFDCLEPSSYLRDELRLAHSVHLLN
jgi:hypothetical protein